MTANALTARTELVQAIAQGHTDQRAPLLLILHEIQEELGYVSASDVEVIALVLNLSNAEVHGVVSFYHDFRTAPPAAHALVLCRAEACQSLGGQALYDETASRAQELGPDVSVREVFCLGNCALGPSGTVDGVLHGRLTKGRIDRLTEAWRS